MLNYFSRSFFYDQFINLNFYASVVRVSSGDPIVNTFSSSQFRNYILKKIYELLEITNDYGGLARDSKNYPINMDVFNFPSNENEFKLKSQKSLWILQSLTGKTVPRFGETDL